MKDNKRQLGNLGEQKARDFLRKRGYQYVCSQWHSRYGELDLVMWDADELVFVEVKLRTNTSYGEPEDMVDWKKMAKIKKTAGLYLEEMKGERPFYRFDIVAIVKKGENLKMLHLQDVFRED